MSKGMTPKRMGSLSPLYKGLSGKTVIHIEDKGKKGFYNAILGKIFGSEARNYVVQDVNDGKLGVITRALKEKDKGFPNIIYLLDKDFDNLLPDDLIFRESNLELIKDEIESLIDLVRNQTYNTASAIKGIRYLEKYSIENYLLKSLEGIKHEIYFRTGNSLEDIRGDHSLDRSYQDILDVLISITTYKFLNKKKGLSLSLNVRGLIDVNTLKIKNNILDCQLGSFKNDCCTAGESFDELLEEAKNTLRDIDIPGKDILEIFLKWLERSSYSIGVSPERAARMLSVHITPEECEELKPFFLLR